MVGGQGSGSSVQGGGRGTSFQEQFVASVPSYKALREVGQELQPELTGALAWVLSSENLRLARTGVMRGNYCRECDPPLGDALFQLGI